MGLGLRELGQLEAFADYCIDEDVGVHVESVLVRGELGVFGALFKLLDVLVPDETLAGWCIL